MKYAIKESDRVIVYIIQSDNNRLDIEARPSCQLRLNRAVEKFSAYSRFFSLPTGETIGKDGETSALISFIKFFIASYEKLDDIDNSDEFWSEAAIRQLKLRLRKEKNILARFYLLGDIESIDNLIRYNVSHYKLSYMSFIAADILISVKEALLDPCIWSRSDKIIQNHKFETFGEFDV